MKIFDSKMKNFTYLTYRLGSPIIDPLKAVSSVVKYPKFIKDLYAYSKLNNSELIKLIHIYPVLNENTKITPFDSHYFYQDIWAVRNIYHSKVKSHFDVGSNVELVGFLTVFTKVTFVDIRPLNVALPNFESIKGSLIKLPFKDNSIRSLSCLNVAEHVGLGRYGDSLDPLGTKKSCNELSRVLAKGGKLYFSLPVGKPRLCFNAHRIHSPTQIIKFFKNLKLQELSGITDNGEYIENIDLDILESSDYACGLFVFTKI